MNGNARKLVGVLAVLALALTGAAQAASVGALRALDVVASDDSDGFDPHARVFTNVAALPLDDVKGERATRVVLDVTSDDQTRIVLVTVRAPDGEAFATLQDPAPAGWVASWTRSAVEYVGVLEAGASERFHLRLLGDALPSGAFKVSLHSGEPGAAPVDMPAPVATQAPTGAICQLITRSTVEGASTFLPFGTLSEKVATSANVLVGVYDVDSRTYVDPARVSGIVRATAANGAEMTFALSARGAVAPWADAPGGAVAWNGGATPVAAAALWDARGTLGYDFFVRNPGPFALEAQASVDGVGACEGELSAEGVVSPMLAAGAAPLAFALLPPEVDSDGDGITNVNELRGNSNPRLFKSTPYEDDDGDGIPNARDPVTVPVVS